MTLRDGCNRHQQHPAVGWDWMNGVYYLGLMGLELGGVQQQRDNILCSRRDQLAKQVYSKGHIFAPFPDQAIEMENFDLGISLQEESGKCIDADAAVPSTKPDIIGYSTCFDQFRPPKGYLMRSWPNLLQKTFNFLFSVPRTRLALVDKRRRTNFLKKDL